MGASDSLIGGAGGRSRPEAASFEEASGRRGIEVNFQSLPYTELGNTSESRSRAGVLVHLE